MLFTRQNKIFNPEEQKSRIIIVGAGSTGSFITLNLAKLGFENIFVIDYDKVESHNIPNQFYREKDIGELKVIALQEIVKDFTGTEISILDTKITNSFNFDDGLFDLETIIIFCLDNIPTRKIIFEKLKEMPIKLIDTRMGGEGYQIYVVDLDNDNEIKQYRERLKGKTRQTPCGEKSVIYTILSIASETCNLVKQIDKGENYCKVIKREMKTYNFISDK